MGKTLSKLGGPRKAAQLDLWKKGKQSTWNITINEAEVKGQLLRKRQITEDKLTNEITKRRKLQGEVDTLKIQVKKQAKEIAGMKYGNPTSQRRPQKSWSESSRQSKHKKKKKLANELLHATSFCEDNGFKPCSVELENTETGIHETIDLSTGKFTPQITEKKEDIHSTLYIKDKYSISDTSYHELSMLSDLPSSKQVKKLKHTLNSHYGIKKAPADITGVQQSLKEQLIPCITNIINNTQGENVPSCFRVKLTGDGTQIGRGFNVVNFAFTILEEGEKARSSAGNHCIGIFKVCEDYSALYEALQDIIIEASDLKYITINGNKYDIKYFLGGDMKFLALVCGIESATSTHSCIWCKIPKDERHNMKMKWSISDTQYGARTIEEISSMSQLSKNNKKRYNCSHKPMFPFIPIHHVIVDSLHLFLQISDVLINLLIRDIRILDGHNRNNTHTMQYQQFLNDKCKVRFKFHTDKETKAMKWRDLTGPEKKRLFEHIDIPTLFPSLENSQKIQKLWNEFIALVNHLSVSTEQSLDKWSPQDFDKKAKQWVTDFASTYQCKDVTPYMHCLAMHVSEFLQLYGNIGQFTQQGLEKLNDLTTIFFQHASNHHEQEALKQILEKRNRIEELEYQGYQRSVREQKCSKCKQKGHNKRKCSLNT